MNLNLSDKEGLIAWLMGGQSVTRGMVNLPRVMALLTRALEQDGFAGAGDEVRELLLGSVVDYEARTGESSGYPERLLITPAVVYMHYADWEAAIVQMLGVPDPDLQPDWKARYRHIGAAMKALSAIGIRVMLAASDVYEKQHGHSMMEVFMASCESGEDFDQSRARLTAQRKGLRAI
ncbi:hypothetical protein [Halomonas piscis]|uniref:hypothetical protein n=1 Tax=Halomonas piscis TaxID=3031727 RepID=UPI00289AAC96|nr:hypothetical protein [Halomonas piscis]